MSATTTTVDGTTAARSERGHVALASGERVAMRMWKDEPPTDSKTPHTSPYETVGYAISGLAELHLGGETVRLSPGTSWVVPAGAEHHYTIIEPFTAVEATAPPAG